MAQIPSADLPVVNPQTGRINLEWYAALQRLNSELAGFSVGGVTSFEGRTGVVVGVAGDYNASEIDNNSGVAGAQVSDALDTLDAGKVDNARQIISGAGLTGGGDLSADRTLAVGAGTGITVNADDVAITAGGVGTTQLADEGVTLAKLIHAAAYTLLLRNAGTTGDPAYVKISDLTDAGAFGSGDKIPVELATGELRKVDFDDLPSGGGGIASVNIQTFVASETYTPTSGMVQCLVISTGGGGGGGGADCTDTSAIALASGGGGGGTCIELFSAATIGASQTVTIGAAGTAGADTGTDGGNGGNTTFGAFHTAGGGVGGDGQSTGGNGIGSNVAGGTATGGLINLPGGKGQSGGYDDATFGSFGGAGGWSFWAGINWSNRTTVFPGSAAGANAISYGQGGGGAMAEDTLTGAAGGAGFAGFCVVIEFIS